MEIQTAIDKIIEVLDADVPTIGKLYDHYPLEAKTATLLKSAFVENDRINLCLVTRPLAEREEDADNYDSFRHTIRIETRKTYIDSSTQQAHEATIDGILSAFDDDTLGGTVSAVYSVRLTRNEPMLFYQRLVHYGLIEVRVESL